MGDYWSSLQKQTQTTAQKQEGILPMAQTETTAQDAIDLDNARIELEHTFDGQFMTPEIVQGEWHNIDGPMGIESFPAEYFSQDSAIENYSGIEHWEAETVKGYGARLSASGYLDSTEWTVYDTEMEAIEFLIETYGDIG